jgi:hypothetical protein
MSHSQLDSSGLKALPPGFEKIYESACVFGGKMPNLIRALRPDRELYEEAMHVSVQSDIFHLRKEKRWSIGRMTEGALARIQRLDISIWSVT